MPEPVQHIDIELEGVGHLLKDKSLRVPQYQRSYAWEDRQVIDFLKDVERSMNAHDDEYFLGSLVIASTEEGHLEVVDGQQRLATATILLAGVRDQFKALADPAAEDVAKDYLYIRDRRTQATSPRLTLNEHDNQFFSRLVLNRSEPAPAPTRLSHKRILKAVELVKSHLDRIAAAAPDKPEALHEIVDFLESNLKVIAVSVPSHANAFLIFETLNDRGLDLATSDLLKNFLFQKAGTQLEEAKARWVGMYELFESAQNEESVVDYIRQMWSSKHGLTREKELYNRIKERVTSRPLAIEFATELRDGARLYQALVNTDHPLWNTYGTTAVGHMRTLNALGITRIRPLLLSVLSKFTVSEVRKVLKLSVSWAVRFMIDGSLGTGTLEEYYSQRAKEIWDGTIRTASQLRDAMNAVVPNDERFKTAFASATVSKAPIARYYLRTLDRQLRGDDQPELVVNENEEEVNLEHILPETITAGWNVTQPIAEANFRRIGNMTLLREAENVDIGNGTPLEKLPLYEASSLRITTDVAARIRHARDWTPTEIAARQAHLAEHAVNAWSLRLG